MASDLHPAQRRYFAEDLVRLRRSDEVRRTAAPQRAARIDPNPHQIDAVVFALARIREGGCILADEVGLGKTIEAGLVITQLLAEGARRVLLLAPKSLIGQWRQELLTLFDLDAKEGSAKPGAFDGDGVFLLNREAAGSEKGRDALLASAPFDLCVIDEAHEVFAGVYKRFTPAGDYDEESESARTAGRVREVLQVGQTPVLLLTATPIQNNLAELWGLVQYVDPLGTLLGDLPTFREIFCGLDDRQLAPGQEAELRGRLKHVLQRTLRRQAQNFLEKPFVNRQARLFEYAMSPAERALYDDVTRYLLEPGIVAFQGNHRKLLLLGFHRRMASSTRALAASLRNVAERLRKASLGQVDGEPGELVSDLDDEDPFSPSGVEGRDLSVRGFDRLSLNGPGSDLGGVSTEVANHAHLELNRVEQFIARADALKNDDGRFRALLKAIDFVSARAGAGQGSEKVVIFTESLVTQEYLRDRLVESGLVQSADVTLFRGQNDSPRALEALKRWQAEVPKGDGVEPSVDIAMRLALVHEFKTRSRVFISTEAGAKGLNLQFCNAVVNWDLPWNPQRIEQRIGRCHRYGQQYDVTVINFLAKDNEAQRLTFDILSQKLELFGNVLSASDEVLHRSMGPGGDVLVSALGAEFEAELTRIYERARTLDEVHSELRVLRERVAADRKRFEETRDRTMSLIEDRFDEDVQKVFRSRRQALPQALREFDAALLEVVRSHARATGLSFREEAGGLVHVDGAVAAVGPSSAHASLHLAHPIVTAAVAEARRFSGRASVEVKSPAFSGVQGRLRLIKATYDGFERVEVLVPVLALNDGRVVDPAQALEVLKAPMTESKSKPSIDDAVMDDAVEEVLFGLQRSVDDVEHVRFERASQQAERFLEDRLLVLRRRRQALFDKLEAATRRRDGSTGSEARTDAEATMKTIQGQLDVLEGKITQLQNRDDVRLNRYVDHIQQRRYAPPRLETLFDLDLRCP